MWIEAALTSATLQRCHIRLLTAGSDNSDLMSLDSPAFPVKGTRPVVLTIIGPLCLRHQPCPPPAAANSVQGKFPCYKPARFLAWPTGPIGDLLILPKAVLSIDVVGTSQGWVRRGGGLGVRLLKCAQREGGHADEHCTSQRENGGLLQGAWLIR